MCRVLLYLGKQTLLDNLLYQPDNSLIHQSYDPKLMTHIQNLAGFGMAVWDNDSNDPKIPYYYKTQELPFFDKNLKRLSLKIKPNCLLAHVRGVAYSEKETVNQENVHPFMFDGFKLALAHNGNVDGISEIKHELADHVSPEILKQVKGTTDSEWIYAVLMSQFADPTEFHQIDEVTTAVKQTLQIFRDCRRKHHLNIASPVNLFITNGNFLVVTRFVYDFGRFLGAEHQAHLQYHSLWYTYGEQYGYFDGEYKMKGSDKKYSISFASEPLTDDKSTWIEVPEYSLVSSWYVGDEIMVRTEDLEI